MTLLPLLLLAPQLPGVQVYAQAVPLKIPQEDVSAFVDGMLDIQLKRDDAAGAEVYLSVGGRTLISEGYGMADPAKKQRMTDQSVVRGGELTIAILAVAVMQQVERGKLELDADVQRYVDVPLPMRADGPMTLRQLLTHSAGLVGGGGSGDVSSVGAYLKAVAPLRPYRAGAVNSFNAWGMALAAYAVERASGESFADYADRHVFAPLHMLGSTLRQPLPAMLAAHASQGFGESTKPALALELLPPSLSLSTTAADMGRFGSMLVNEGKLDGEVVLQPSSVKTLLTRSAVMGLSAEIPSMTPGFHEVWFNGSRYAGISGDTTAFHSDFEVDVARRVVLYVAYNSSGHPNRKGEPAKLEAYARGELIHGIFDRYQPFHPVVTTLKPTLEQEQQATVTCAPASAMPDETKRLLHLSIDAKDHTLVVDRFISDRDTVKHWAMIGDGLWQQYPQDRIYFLPKADGLPERLALAADPATHWMCVRP